MVIHADKYTLRINRIVQKVWTSYLSCPKSKPKNHLFSGVISVQILWLGIVDMFQTFEDLESIKDKQAETKVIQALLDAHTSGLKYPTPTSTERESK